MRAYDRRPGRKWPLIAIAVVVLASIVGVVTWLLPLRSASQAGTAGAAATSIAAATGSGSPSDRAAAPEFAAFWQQHRGAIGSPTSAPASADGVLRQEFAHGVMYGSETGQLGFASGGILSALEKADPASVGTPVGMATCYDRKRSCYQELTAGVVVWSERDGAQVLSSQSTPRLAGSPNFRDVAGEGSGLTLAGGGHMRRSVVYRSGDLSDLTPTDVLVLRALGVTTVFDLRTPSAVRTSPDPRIKGVRDVLINLFGVDSTASTPLHSVAEGAGRVEDWNRGFVADPVQRARLRSLLEQIAASDGPVLIHCTSGKDRSGWSAAMLQFIAGASREQVLSEYLKSNSYRKQQIASDYRRDVARYGTVVAQARRAVNRVEPSYLEAGLSLAEKRYGSVMGYLTRGVGLSDATLSRLRAKLVTD